MACEDYIHKIGGKITEDIQKIIEEEWAYLFNVEDAIFYGGFCCFCQKAVAVGNVCLTGAWTLFIMELSEKINGGSKVENDIGNYGRRHRKPFWRRY